MRQKRWPVHPRDMIETLTGRRVLAFLSHACVQPDLTIEVFLMDRPLPGFGALELVDPPSPDVGDADLPSPRASAISIRR